MKQLEVLETKVLQIIQKNKELQSQNNILIADNKKLIEQNQQLEKP